MRKYEIYDRKSCNLLAEGTFKEVNGQYVIQCLLPDSDDIEVFIDGKKVQTVPRIKPEVVEDDQIKEMYWSYGKDHKRLTCKVGSEKDNAWETKRYGDLNLHIVTEDGNDGKKVVVTLENTDDDIPLSVEKRKLVLSDTVHKNNVLFENVFAGYTIN